MARDIGRDCVLCLLVKVRSIEARLSTLEIITLMVQRLF